MPIRNGKRSAIAPLTLADTLDGNPMPKGSMAALSNLIPTPTTPRLLACRPAAMTLTSFAGFSNPGFVSVFKVIYPRIYGMIATSRNPGHDEPFCYDSSTGAFVTISGVTSGNTPTSPATTGAWTPPTMDIIGSKIIITHPGFSGTGSNFFGVIDIATPASPAWSAANTATNALPSVPTFVANFNGRAYYACGNVSYFSDVLAPLTLTNASQQLTFGGTDPITAFAAQPFFTTQQGGIAAALLVFKQASIFQVTGDSATSNLASNKLIDNIGTQAPRSPAVTDVGVKFLAQDGIRTINLQGQVSTPDLVVFEPFQQVVTISRVSAGFAAGIYRISLQSFVGEIATAQEFWYDVSRQIWTGPHSYTHAQIQGFVDSFVAVSVEAQGIIEQTNIIPTANDSHIERGVDMTFNYQTSLLPEDDGILQASVVIQTTIFMGFGEQTTLTFNMLDPSGNVLATTSQTTPVEAPTGATNRLVPWPKPVQFTRGAFQVSGNSASGLLLGTCFLYYRSLGRVAFDAYPDQGIPNPSDWGSVADPIITVSMDWGSVVDPVVSSIDFGVLP